MLKEDAHQRIRIVRRVDGVCDEYEPTHDPNVITIVKNYENSINQ